ncbi:MAG: carbamoyltransferase HypF [Candidatus Aminicenantia bacterium]
MEAKRIIVKGIVQGVGFRPFIFRIANKFGLKGWVLNSSSSVVIHIEGDAQKIKEFIKALELEKPPPAIIDNFYFEDAEIEGFESFVIRESIEIKDGFQPVSPDLATCDDCLKELFDPMDRRYLYPFINCTNCGPRFTIIEDIPYDREKTTMKYFFMCKECRREYEDPMNRRFHAQPNACPVCGPQVEYRKGNFLDKNNWIKKVVNDLKEGLIIAIKGLGGFHLACDALNEVAVRRLRERKFRRDKPFAVMMKDIEMVEEFCYLNEKEKELLLSPKRPIVLLREKESSKIAPSVAPNQKYQGIMLPSTPLHHIINNFYKKPLVMTSGNLTEEPIAMENDEALKRLKGIADSFILHNRGIYTRYDDSVVRVAFGEEIVLRRARGYAPFPISLPFEVEEILACGAELKNTFCLTKKNYAFISQHMGDLENMETMENFLNNLELFKRLFRIKPKIVAYDLHPQYLSTQYALSLKNVELIGVQHHHAHMASCMIENGFTGKAIGVSFDGTGYGLDRNIWGGEFLVGDFSDFKRRGHLSYVPLAGGEETIRKPYRMALCYLLSQSPNIPSFLPNKFLKSIKDEEIIAVDSMIKNRFNTYLTSSAGRLFDAVSAILGIRGVNTFEAQAAIELEMVADEREEGFYPFEFKEELIFDQHSIFNYVLEEIKNGVEVEKISARFHNTIALLILRTCEILREKEGIKTVAISGGVFQNFFLLRKVVNLLREEGFSVLLNKKIPTNDGGVSLGQAIIAFFRSKMNQI